MIKPTFCNELDQALNVSGEFTIFSPINEEKSKNFVKNIKNIFPAQK